MNQTSPANQAGKKKADAAMATTAATATIATTTAGNVNVDQGGDEEFKPLPSRVRFRYDIEKSQKATIRGYLVGKETIKTKKAINGQYTFYVFKTTAPIKALNRAKELVEVPVGGSLMLPEKTGLKFELDALLSPSHVKKLSVTPLGKEVQPSGFSMQMWKILAADKSYLRKDVCPETIGLPGAVSPVQVVTEAPPDDDNEPEGDIPF